MELSNSNVQYLYNWLNLPLHGEKARARNKFTSIIEKQYFAALNGRTDILKAYADKDKKTKEPIIENGHYKMNEKVLEKAKAEVQKYLDKKTNYVFSKNDKVIIRIVVKILNDAKIPLDIANGKIYDEVMGDLEAVK